jgi:hypothetical protein
VSKRLQVLLEESELREIRRRAEQRHMTVAEWVRQSLRRACAEEPRGEVGNRLAVIRAAAAHAFPTAEMDEIAEQIARGAGRGLP